MASRLKRLFGRLTSLIFYVGLDITVGGIAYVISSGETDLTPGKMMIRIMTAIMLANGIVGGPDIMLFWRESGRRMVAETERDVAQQKLAERNQEISERDREILERNREISERDREISELRALVSDLQERVATQERRPARRARRRRLRDNGQ